MTSRTRLRPAALVQPALLAALGLTGIALAFVQTAPPPNRWPGADEWSAASIVLLAFAALCATLLRPGRSANHPPAGASPDLVVHASQTGLAEMLAQRTAAAIAGDGDAAPAHALGRLDMASLSGAERAWFVVSTTGEGDAPDPARHFVADAMHHRPDLGHLEYALLSLGDRRYIDFCGFGRRLDAWLRACGARPMAPAIEVDDGDPTALARWRALIADRGGHAAALAPGPEAPWRLDARRHSNAGSPGGAIYRVRLVPEGPLPAWQAGDIAEITPRNDPAAVARTLAALGRDGDLDAGGAPLRDRLSHRRLPAPSALPALRDLTPDALIGQLRPLPHRSYSIASIPADGAVELLVRRMPGENGDSGLGSGWLCEHAPPGSSMHLHIRSNPGFHAPPGAPPLILIGNGTGLAGLRAHLRARAAAGERPNWLLFGERTRAHDLHFGDEIARWQQDGTLTRVDLAFSRDQDERVYVQHRLSAAADTLRAWIDNGAALLVCGSRDGMAAGVDATLREILGSDRVDALMEDGRYRRDIY